MTEPRREQPVVQQTVVIVGKQKSVGVAFLLAFLFGPLGLLYASVIGGIVMMVLAAVVGFITLGFGLIPVWFVSMIWAVVAANRANKQVATSFSVNATVGSRPQTPPQESVPPQEAPAPAPRRHIETAAPQRHVASAVQSPIDLGSWVTVNRTNIAVAAGGFVVLLIAVVALKFVLSLNFNKNAAPSQSAVAPPPQAQPVPVDPGLAGRGQEERPAVEREGMTRADSAARIAGTAVDLPNGINLRMRPEESRDVVLTINANGLFSLTANRETRAVAANEIESRLKAVLGDTRSDRVLYVNADKDLPFSRVLEATEPVTRAGVPVMRLVMDQQPGTQSTVEVNPGEKIWRVNPKGEWIQNTRMAIDVFLPVTKSAALAGSMKSPIVLESTGSGQYSINGSIVDRAQLPNRLHEIFTPRPDRVLYFKGNPGQSYSESAWQMDVARGAGAVIIALAPQDVVVPSTLPDIDLTRRITTEADFTKGESHNPEAVREPIDADAVYLEFQVEKPATQAPGSPQPAYPDILRQAGVEGEVLASFVVDAAGRADSTTFKVIRSTHELFVTAVRNALPAMRFIPAEIGRKKVKQLVQQPFSFAQKDGS